MLLYNILTIPEIRKKIKFYILTTFSIGTIISLSSSPESLFNNNLIKNNLYENILFFKSAFPILIFLSLILVSLKEFKKIILIEKSYIFIFFVFLILLQII